MQAAGSVLQRTTACDCVWSKLQAILLRELPIAPKSRILKAFPSFLVWRDPWFRQVAWSVSDAINVGSL